MAILDTGLINPISFDEPLAQALTERGWWAGKNYLNDALIGQLNQEVNQLREQRALERAGIGRQQAHQLNADVRRDRIHWLNGNTLAQCLFLKEMENLRLQLNRELFLGLFEFESHFALYEPGAFYKRHVDSFVGAANRMVSVVCYLNDHWVPEEGGELVIYDRHSQQPVCKLLPEAGTVAIFLSEEIPHEVLTANRNRASIAGWFRVNGQRNDKVNPAS